MIKKEVIMWEIGWMLDTARMVKRKYQSKSFPVNIIDMLQ
jgi:hypothetical protein